MRQTDIKTIYLTGEELKLALCDFISSRNIELATQVATHDVQLSLGDEGMMIRVSTEIEAYNDSTAEPTVNE